MLWWLCSHQSSHENRFLKKTAYCTLLNVWVDVFYVIDEAVVDKVSIGRLYSDTVTNRLLQNVVSNITLSYVLLLLY